MLLFGQSKKIILYKIFYCRKLGKAVGMMITASHNPACDNGLKLIDPNGRMLAMECEDELTKIANGTEQEFENFKNDKVSLDYFCIFNRRNKIYELGKFSQIQHIKCNSENGALIPVIVIATDTRPSSFTLYEEAIKGINLLNIPVDIKFFDKF
jgi:phosphomannomutase